MGQNRKTSLRRNSLMVKKQSNDCIECKGQIRSLTEKIKVIENEMERTKIQVQENKECNLLSKLTIDDINKTFNRFSQSISDLVEMKSDLKLLDKSIKDMNQKMDQVIKDNKEKIEKLEKENDEKINKNQKENNDQLNIIKDDFKKITYGVFIAIFVYIIKELLAII